MVFGKIKVQQLGFVYFPDKAGCKLAAVQLILRHPRFNLVSHLVDGTERAMEFCELVVVVLEIGAPEIVPSVVVFHLNASPPGKMTGKVSTIEEAGAGVGANKNVVRNVEVDGEKNGIEKARRRVFAVSKSWFDGKMVHVKYCFLMRCKSTQDSHASPEFNCFSDKFLSTELSTG